MLQKFDFWSGRRQGYGGAPLPSQWNRKLSDQDDEVAEDDAANQNAKRGDFDISK
jgi:hypothetical protein